MHTIPSHITPKNPADRQRWREQALRLRLLEGDFEDDVRDDIRRLFAAEIAYDLELAPDTSRNTFLLVNQQLSTAYLKPPSISLGEEDENDLSEVVTPRLWPVQRLNELRVRALNESVIKVGWSTDGEASYQVIDPSTLVVTAHPDYPDRPARVEWLRPREDGKVWTWETWDSIEGIFRIEKVRDNGTREDVTEQYAPGLEGRYPYEDAEGFVLPFVLYHASAVLSSVVSLQWIRTRPRYSSRVFSVVELAGRLRERCTPATIRARRGLTGGRHSLDLRSLSRCSPHRPEVDIEVLVDRGDGRVSLAVRAVYGATERSRSAHDLRVRARDICRT